MALIFSQGYMRGNGNPNLDVQIQNGGTSIPKIYIDDLTDTVYGFDSSQVLGEKWYKYFAGVVSKSVNLKVWLRGPSLGTTMSTTLATNELLPLNEPYEGLEFVRKGYSGESVADVNVFKDNNIVDWILVELRDRDNPEIVRYNRAALLNNVGQILDVDGVSLVEFPFVRDFDYFISIRHRNHLGIMTKEAVDITQPIDFTLLNTEYTGPSDYRILHSPNYCLRAGKIGNGKILSYQGNNSWTSKVLPFISYDVNIPINNIYSVFDLNFDGNVIYNGAGSDRTLVIQNIGGSAQINNPRFEFIPPYENRDIYSESIGYFTVDHNNQNFKTKDAGPYRQFEEKYHGKTSIVIPKGTTAERPTTPESAMIRYNTDDNKLEYYNGTLWVQL